jgi:hypothetical protein
MFANLTGKQKSAAVILIILCLVAIVLAIYFGVSKRCIPVPPPKPFFKKFNDSSTTNPWSVPTYYKYSYYDGTLEGPPSEPSAAISSTTSTNPVIQVTANSLYSIKIYRAVNTPPGDYTLLDVTVDPSGQFTDTDNPYKPPPAPKSVPVLIQWHEGNSPWITPTFYKYSYFDGIQEGPTSDPSEQILDNTQTDPELSVALLSPYSIRIYRAVGTPNDFSLLNVNVKDDGTFTDTANPYTPPPKPKSKPAFVNWHSGTPPWITPTFYKYSYFDGIQEGPTSDPSDAVSSDTDTNPEFFVTLLSPYSIRIYRAINDDYSQLDVQVDANGRFTDTANPYTPPPKPTDAPFLKSWAPQYM